MGTDSGTNEWRSLVFVVHPNNLPPPFLLLLQSALKGANVTVLGCLNHGMPLFQLDNSSLRCESGGWNSKPTSMP